MTDTRPKKGLLLSIAIALLVVLNGMQLYGIFSESTRNNPPQSNGDTDTTRAPIQINVLNGCGTAGVGNTMTKFCRQAGYDVVEMGNYKSFDVEESIVIDRRGTLHDAQRLASVLGIKRKNVIQQFSNDHMVSASVVIGKDYRQLIPWKK